MSMMEEINCSVENIHSAEETVAYLWDDLAQVIIKFIIPLVTLIGLLGNGTFIFVYCRNHTMRTTTNIYLINLAIADLSLLVIGTFQYLWTYISSPIYIYDFAFSSSFGCAFPNFVVYLTYFTSVFLVTIVMIERYLAICKPPQHYEVKGKTRALKLTSMAWIMSGIIAAFRYPHWPEKHCLQWPDEHRFSGYPKTIDFCSGKSDWSFQVVFYADIAQYIVAVTIVTFACIGIIRQLKRRSAEMFSEESRRIQVSHDRNRIARMLIINVIIFFVCLTPFELLNIDGVFKEISGYYFVPYEGSELIAWIGRLTMQINSACNPIVYSIIHVRYRKAFLEAWRCQLICGEKVKKLRPRNSQTSISRFSTLHAEDTM